MAALLSRLASLVVALGLALAPAATSAQEELPSAGQTLESYDLRGDATLAEIRRLGRLAREDSDAGAEARLRRALVATDLVIAWHVGAAAPDLLDRLAPAFGAHPADLVDHLELELDDLADGPRASAASDALVALDLLAEERRHQTPLRTTRHPRTDTLLAAAIAHAHARGRLDALRPADGAPIGPARCPPSFADLDPRTRAAIGWALTFQDALARIEASAVGGDPLARAVLPTIGADVTLSRLVVVPSIPVPGGRVVAGPLDPGAPGERLVVLGERAASAMDRVPVVVERGEAAWSQPGAHGWVDRDLDAGASELTVLVSAAPGDRITMLLDTGATTEGLARLLGCAWRAGVRRVLLATTAHPADTFPVELVGPGEVGRDRDAVLEVLASEILVTDRERELVIARRRGASPVDQLGSIVRRTRALGASRVLVRSPAMLGAPTDLWSFGTALARRGETRVGLVVR